MCDSSGASMMKISIRSPLSAQRRKMRVFLPLLVLAVSCIVGTAWPTAGAASAQDGKAPKKSPGKIDVQRLAGRWVRPDGGYVLELREIRKDGSVSAAYFNPRPIKVFRAKWSRREGKINLSVELRDVNYPGSTYNLQYDPESDRLKGTYFQAVERLTFEIQFVRSK
jgi:hypothetical protein